MDYQDEQRELKEVLKHKGFKIALKKLVLRVYDLDSVRNISPNQSDKHIAINQLSNKKTVELIEEWLDDIFSIKDINKFIGSSKEKDVDAILKRADDEEESNS